MTTTLILPDPLMIALKRRAAERGTSLSALAAELLGRGFDEKPEAAYEPSVRGNRTGARGPLGREGNTRCARRGEGPPLLPVARRSRGGRAVVAERVAAGPVVFAVDTNLLVYAAVRTAPDDERALGSERWVTTMHDLHTVALMREHGVREVHTADRDFARFRGLRVVSPLLAA